MGSTQMMFSIKTQLFYTSKKHWEALVSKALVEEDVRKGRDDCGDNGVFFAALHVPRKQLRLINKRKNS